MYDFNFPLLENYHVYSCKNYFNEYFELTNNRNEFQCESSLKVKKIIQIEFGDGHTCALTGYIVPNS